MASSSTNHNVPLRNIARNKQQIYCIFCYKLARHSENDHGQSKHRANCEDEKIFLKFYKLICSTISTRQQLDKSTKSPDTSTTGTCDDCFCAIETFFEITHKIESLQLKLKKHLNQLSNVMKCAGRVPSRVKNFKESFHFQYEDDNGELVVTIKQGQMDKALQCRKQIYDACSQSEKQISTVFPFLSFVDVTNPPSNADNESMEEDGNEDSCNSDSDSTNDDVDDHEISPITPSTRNTLSSLPTNSKSPLIFQCSKDNCGKIHPSKESLERHLKEHGNFPCDFCDFTADQARNLVDHEIQFHWKVKGSDKIECPRCPKLLGPSKYDQAMHYFRVHFHFNGNGRAKCRQCGRVFKGWSNGDANCALRKHLQSHLGVKPFKCSACGISVSSKSSLKRHFRRIHPTQSDLIRETNGGQQQLVGLLKSEMESSSGQTSLENIDEFLM